MYKQKKCDLFWITKYFCVTCVVYTKEMRKYNCLSSSGANKHRFPHTIQSDSNSSKNNNNNSSMTKNCDRNKRLRQKRREENKNKNKNRKMYMNSALQHQHHHFLDRKIYSWTPNRASMTFLLDIVRSPEILLHVPIFYWNCIFFFIWWLTSINFYHRSKTWNKKLAIFPHDWHFKKN